VTDEPLLHPLVLLRVRVQLGRLLRQPRCWTGTWLVFVYPVPWAGNLSVRPRVLALQ